MREDDDVDDVPLKRSAKRKKLDEKKVNIIYY
jgi:hypothetical protein